MLKTGCPCLRAQGWAAEELDGRLARHKRGWPSPQRVTELGDVGFDRLDVSGARWAGVGKDQATHQVGTLGCQQQRGLAAQGLTYDHDRREPQLLHREHGIGDMGGTRHVSRKPLASAVPTRVEREHPAAVGQPASGFAPLARIACQPVQQQRARTVPAEVKRRQRHPISFQHQLGRHRPFLPRARRLGCDGVVRLRRWDAGDIGCVREASADTAIPEATTVPAAFTEQAGLAFIARQLGRAEHGEGLSLAIADAVSGRAQGLVWLGVRPQPGVVGIGYWVAPAARGRGLARRAVRLATRWALLQGVVRVEAWVEPENERSQHVLRAAGFRCEGVLRSFLAFEARRADAVVFSCVASDVAAPSTDSDWPQARSDG
jgi:ribosomal-protein-alanine N-acetyltransferase